MKTIINFVKSVLIKLEILSELFSFLLKQKLWWLIPLIVIILIFIAILILGQTTGVGPFIYPLF